MNTFIQFLTEVDSRGPRVRDMNGSFKKTASSGGNNIGMGAKHNSPSSQDDPIAPNLNLFKKPQQAKPAQAVPPTVDPQNKFIQLAISNDAIRNDMMAMLGVMYRQRRINPDAPMKQPTMIGEVTDPATKQAIANLYKFAENMSRQDLAVLATNIQQKKITKKLTGQPAVAKPSAPTQSSTVPQPTDQQIPTLTDVVPPPGQNKNSNTQQKMSRLQSLLKAVQPSLNDQQLVGVMKAVNQSKKKLT